MSLDFSPYRAILLDLDGTICHENQLLPGARELLARLKRESRNFACVSNSGDSPLRVMTRLESLGIDLDPNQIYTAAAAACDFVVEQFTLPDSTEKAQVFNLATESVQEMLDGLVEWVDDPSKQCDAILVAGALSAHASEDRRRTALQLARAGAAVVGICADRVFPSSRGIEFGAGAMTWMLAYAAGVNPIFCGKPDKIFFTELCRRLGVDPTWCILIGDNLESDVHGGKSVGMRTILTLAGVSRQQDMSKFPADLQPDLVIKDLRELV